MKAWNEVSLKIVTCYKLLQWEVGTGEASVKAVMNSILK